MEISDPKKEGGLKTSPDKKAEIEEKEEKIGERDFPPHYSKIKEEKRDINDTKAPEWLDAKIKIKEVNIANEGQPKIAKIVDYGRIIKPQRQLIYSKNTKMSLQEIINTLKVWLMKWEK